MKKWLSLLALVMTLGLGTMHLDAEAKRMGGGKSLGMQRQAITEAVSPILTALYQEKGCGIMIDRESVFIMNPAMDVTPLVIQRLNTALPTLSFNRMPVPAQPQS